MNIHLRALEPKDASGMLEWMTDPDIVCFFRFDASNASLETCLDYIASAVKDESARHFAIADESDEYLGTITLKEIDEKRRTAEYAISTRKYIHGRGVAQDATEKILHIGFIELGLDMIFLNVLVENERANQFYRKVGFEYDRCEKNAVCIRDSWKDLNWYYITREKYLEEQRDD